MTKAKSSSENEDSALPDVAAADMILVLAGQVASLRGLTAAVEEALSSSLCSCSPLSEDAFVAFQRIDFMRQSLKDIEALLSKFGPSIVWHPEAKISKDTFSSVVDMGDSIGGMFGASSDASPPKLTEESASDDDNLDLW